MMSDDICVDAIRAQFGQRLPHVALAAADAPGNADDERSHPWGMLSQPVDPRFHASSAHSAMIRCSSESVC